MRSCQAERRLDRRPDSAALARPVRLWPWVLFCLVVLAMATAALGRQADEPEGVDEVEHRGLDQIDIITQKLHRYGHISLKVGAVLLGIIILKIINPFQQYHSAQDRLLERAVRDVDELLKRIRKEAETQTPEPAEEAGDAGILAGMAEIAEFSQAEEVPAYVLTVNDVMLDKIQVTLKRLRRFKEGHADRYREYMYSVLKGIKTITEESASANVPSSLAVDVREYFRDERRYRAWKKLLTGTKETGDNQEVVDTFLLFMRDIREGRPLASPPSATASVQDLVAASEQQGPEVPDQLNEETLPAVQQAAVEEAGHLVSWTQKGVPTDRERAWQFELVKRQEQLRLREEAKRMLIVFLECQRKALPRLTGTKMLPCRAWEHVLYMLGVAETADLHERVEGKLLTIQEIIILQKAFLQTFVKRASLEHVYGHGEQAELMIDLHLPQLRREALTLLRKSRKMDPELFDRATAALNDEETPKQNQVERLIEHYVHQQYDPPSLG